MVDWHSPAEIAHDAREVISPSALIRAIHLVRRRGLQQSHPRSFWPLPVSTHLFETLSCRVYMHTHRLSWEFCVSFDFDYGFFSGKRKFRWPLVTCLSLVTYRYSNARL